jgi:glycosyltransferase involved in cell wall biosynthesis
MVNNVGDTAARRPLRIAYIYDAVYPFSKGGGERRIYEIARRLAARGHDVHWFSWKWWPDQGPTRLAGINLHGTTAPPPLYGRSGRRTISEAVRFGLNTWQMLERGTFDVIDCGQFPYFHCFAVRARPDRYRSFFITWYEVWNQRWYSYLGRGGWLGIAVERLAVRLPNRIIAISAKTRDGLLTVGVDDARIDLVPNGVDVEAVSRIPSSSETFDLIYVGRLREHKNVHVLLEAMSIAKRAGHDWTAIVIGGGPERLRLEGMAKNLGIANQVRFAGELERFEDVVRAMKSARVFVHLSTKDSGASLTLLEASSCGLPIVGVDDPLGIDMSVVRDGENGLVLPHLDGEAVARALDALLRDGERRRRMSVAALRVARAHDWEQIAERHERLYEGALKSSR